MYDVGPTTPRPKDRGLGFVPFRSPLLRESLFDFFSSAYLDVSVQRVSFRSLWIQLGMMGGLVPTGLPHSDIPGSKLF